jgi:hypothetical protein
MLSYVCGLLSVIVGIGTLFVFIPIPSKTSQEDIFFDAREDLDTYFEAQEPEDSFWAYLHHKGQHIPILYPRTETNLSVIPSIQEDTIRPEDSISNCESRSSSERSVNIFGYRKEDYLYYRNGRDFIELKETAKPIRQEGESAQDYAVRKFRIVTRDFTAFDIEE